MYMTSFDGTEGSYLVKNDPIQLTYRKCVSQVRDCPENRQGVHEGDMSSFKKANYFDAYINTFSVMHAPLEEGTTRELTISTEDKEMKPLDMARPEAYKTLIALRFEPIQNATFANAIVINGNGNSIVVRNTDITIPGVLTVFKGTRECTQQVNIGEITCMKYENNSFDFYQYGDSLIKIGKGINVEDYITLKSLK